MLLAKKLLWYMHGVSAYFVRNVRKHLNTVFDQRWIECESIA